MKYTLLIVSTLFLTTAALAQQSTTTPQDPTALGNAFFKAMLDEDGKTMSGLISSDLSIISFNGQAVDGSLLVQGIDGGAVIVETGVVSNAATRQYNTNAAVMTGTWKAKGNIQGKPFDNNVTFSVMSAKQGGSWKIVNVQFTPQRE
ncbi:nuclear transport factor 2 family protein [Spirosoma aerophilum]